MRTCNDTWGYAAREKSGKQIQMSTDEGASVRRFSFTFSTTHKNAEINVYTVINF